MNLEIRPADWEGFAAVMGERGGCGGCWCMLWRRTKAEMEAGKGAGNRAAMAEIFASRQVPGLVARRDDVAVGWIQVDHRAAFPRLAHARVLRPVDAEPVWSVACFLVDRTARRQGVSVALLEAACGFARNRGATILEGYPLDTPNARYPAVYAWTGFVVAFRTAGFEEVARRSPTRPIMRRHLT